MKIIFGLKPITSPPKYMDVYSLLGLLLLLWFLLPKLLLTDSFVGVIDPNIWLLVVFALLCFIGLTGISWWLLQTFWMALGLPTLNNLIFNFKSIAPWLQLAFYWASFALLLLAAVGCLIAIC
jgi:hypothetical protein